MAPRGRGLQNPPCPRRAARYAENAGHAGDGGECDGERCVAFGQVGDDIRSRSARAGGEDHEPDGEFPGESEDQCEGEGEGREKKELATKSDDFCFGLEHHAPEVGGDEAEAHPEKDREEGDGQCDLFEKFAGHATKLPNPLRAVDGRVCDLGERAASGAVGCAPVSEKGPKKAKTGQSREAKIGQSRVLSLFPFFQSARQRV